MFYDNYLLLLKISFTQATNTTIPSTAAQKFHNKYNHYTIISLDVHKTLALTTSQTFVDYLVNHQMEIEIEIFCKYGNLGFKTKNI